jgi:hypothetical protein
MTKQVKFETPLKRVIRKKLETPGKCMWFALCDNPATETEPPILGDVPICKSCAAKMRG